MRKSLLLFAIFLGCSAGVYAQQHIVNGNVTGLDGNPIPSATVQSNIGNVSAVTDANGRFSISVSDGAVLTISSVGYETKEIEVKNQTTIYAILAPKAKGLNDVVVTALGIMKKENSIGYSTTQVKGRELVQSRPISVANGLTGKVSGMQVNTINNGVFAPTRIILRGNRSLTGNNQALIVVDGSIYYNDISNLNPDDIESINVLKGSSAAAIYGSDASNGVLLITTKKGSSGGKPVINFFTTVQVESISYMPSLQTQFGSNGGESFPQNFNDLTYYIPDENQQFGPQFNGKSVPLGRPVGDGSLLMVPYSAIPNGKRDFFQNAVTTQNNLSYSAGDDKSSFFLSGQYVYSNGVMPNDHGNRAIVRVGGSRTFDIFSAAYSVAYTYKYTNTTNTGDVYNNVINTPQHVPLTSLSDWQHNKYADPSGYFNDWADNPYFTIDQERNKTTSNNVAGNVQLNLQPLPWLKLSYLASVNYSNSRYEFLGGIAHYNEHARTSDTVIYSNADGTGLDTAFDYIKPQATGPATTQATYNTSTTNNFLFTSDFLITGTKDISKDFNLSVTLGVSYINNQINYLAVNAGPLFVPVYNINSLTGIPGLGQYNNLAKKLGYFGDATLGYKNYAFLHGNYRTDEDSRLSTANMYIPYYDIDAALVLSEIIPALKESKNINYLKIRAAHSLTGNASALGNGSPYIADGAYATDPTFSTAPGFPFSGLGGFQLNTNVANPNIKPEQVTENELGLEVAFLKNRVSLVAVIYQQKLKDGIVFTNTASSSGFKSSLVNAANTENNGLELGVKAVLVNSQEVTWNIGVNYTHMTSKVLSINGDLQSLNVGGNTYAVVGQPYPVIETGDWTRDPQGHVIVDPITGNPSLDPNLKIEGNAVPTDLLGITTSVSWNHFTLTATMDYRGGYKVFNQVGENMTFTGISTITTATGRQRFVFPNSVIDQGGGKYVKNTNVTTDDAGYNFWGGTYLNVGSNYITSGDFWKLREVAIRYDFPNKWYAKAKVFQDISFTLSGRNLLMRRPATNNWTDPEFNDNTSNAVGRNTVGQIPPTRIISGTLSIRF